MMENLNAETIKEAVACKTANVIGCMNDDCAYFYKGCGKPLFEDILALIENYEEKIFALEKRLKECENGYEGTLALERAKVKELTEENERLIVIGFETVDYEIDKIKETKAVTVRKMQERLNQVFGTSTKPDTYIRSLIDEVAKEMLENYCEN